MPPTERESSTGPVVAIIIVLAVIILGGLYFWGERSGMYGSDADTAGIVEQSSSDEVESIEADLEATELEDIGAELETL